MSADPNLLTGPAKALWEKVRAIFPTAVFTSGKRDHIPPGGSKTSQHFTGDAFDFQVPGVDPLDVQKSILASGLPFGQSIAEYGLGMGPRNHLSVGTKGQVMTARNGVYKTTGFSGFNLDGPGFGRTALQILLGKDAGNAGSDILAGPVAETLQAPAKAIEGLTDWNNWFQRGAVLIFALIFIAAAVFAFRGSDVVSIASKAGRLTQ